MAVTSITSIALSIVVVSAKCFEPSPAFPIPQWHKSGPWIPALDFAAITYETARLDAELLADSSFSIEVTSGEETLWTKYHSAHHHDEQRPGVVHVDGDSQYRIASITKVFTVLGLLYQHASPNFSLDDAIDMHIPELAASESGAIRWQDITVRSLASQLSGIRRDFANGMVVGKDEDATPLGLPLISNNFTSPCHGTEKNQRCTRADLLRAVKQQKPVFVPNQKSTYSNDAFGLLGLALEEATDQDYSDYITSAIFRPLNMTMSTFTTPPDDHAVLPRGRSSFWDVDEGVQRPTGGIYASASDMSKFLRYVLNNYNSIATGVNWFLPASWSTGTQTFYGMPWEILRSDTILQHSKRPVTIISKSGALPGYTSQIFLLPEYNLGVTILVAGDATLLDRLQTIMLTHLIQAAEAAVWNYIGRVYTTTNPLLPMNPSLNSSLFFTSSPENGLTMKTFISNSTDILGFVIPKFLVPDLGVHAIPWRAQLVPTMLFKNESSQTGEIWRMVIVRERKRGDAESGELFGEFCLTDIDTLSYGGLPLNEVVFWLEDRRVEVSAFGVTFERSDGRRGVSGTLATLSQKILG